MNTEDLSKLGLGLKSNANAATEDRRFRRVAGLEDGLEKLAASIMALAIVVFIVGVLISVAIHYRP